MDPYGLFGLKRVKIPGYISSSVAIVDLERLQASLRSILIHPIMSLSSSIARRWATGESHLFWIPVMKGRKRETLGQGIELSILVPGHYRDATMIV